MLRYVAHRVFHTLDIDLKSVTQSVTRKKQPVTKVY